MKSQEYYNAKSNNVKSFVIEIPKSRDNSVINKKLIWTPIDDFFGKLTTENGDVVHNDIGKITTDAKFENRDVFAITKVHQKATRNLKINLERRFLRDRKRRRERGRPSIHDQPLRVSPLSVIRRCKPAKARLQINISINTFDREYLFY